MTCYDFIIVGGGSAGCVVAVNLANAGFKIAIVESSENFNSNYYVTTPSLFGNLWGDVTYAPDGCEYSPKWNEWTFPSVSGDEPFIYDYVRAANLGGCASHHAMVAFRGKPEVYDEWAMLLNDPSWAYDNVKLIFDKIEKEWLSVTHTESELFELQFLQTMTNAFDVTYVKDTSECPIGIGFTNFMITKDGERSNSSLSLLQKYLPHKNIHLYLNHLVTKIVIEKNKTKGVEAILGPYIYKADTLNKTCAEVKDVIRINCKREVILCGGSINSPQLLLLSGIGNEEELNKFNIPVIKHLPEVGQHLKDHPEIWVNFELQNITHRWQVYFPYSQDSPMYQEYKEWKIGTYRYPFSSVSLEQTVKNDKQVHICLYTIPSNNFNVSEWFNDYDYKKKTYASFLIEVTNPTEVGFLSLQSSDPLDMPYINMGLNTDENAEAIAEGVGLVQNWMEAFQEQYQPVQVYPDPALNTEGLETFFKKRSAYGHHINGTCGMGRVVDSKGRVYGIKNLRVCDASIFPTIVTANPCLPVYMVAEKISQNIIDCYRK